ncbi:Tetratricopeptide repeat-containing protein [Methylomagnum ishizawai]|uniref:Tetratricopeptide repeat-containing protein n=1 Tax=Methylomagnum ishizawai TaxID=1760988 RepID=A0A1Y6CZG9_9GAMM|nr:ATP-binding protein [Methylomagnum ishizawai]SMF95706.1 Tetratricopeptide repeat-containing protein [Methylomagnum ishizawai]
MQTFSIFISSPGDVEDERRRAERVIRKLQTEFDRYVLLEPIFWEHQPQSAHQHFQDQIKKLPSATDLVVCILWSRLGTRLPEDKFQRGDGTPYRSGTEFEFEDAVAGYRNTRKTPDLWIYRKTAEVLVSLSDPHKADKERQKALLDEFLQHWLGSADDHFKAGFNSFADADDFERQFTEHLRMALREHCPQYRTEIDELPSWTRDQSPYRGLAYFDLEHAPVFRGRDAAVHAVLAQLGAQADAGRPFVLVLGASGAGKSSLLRAGLLHALVEQRRVAGVDLWRYAVFRPAAAVGGDLPRGLAAALLADSALPELAQAGFGDSQALAEQLAHHPEGLAGPLSKALDAAAERLRQERRWNFAPVARLVLVVDPLEEIFRCGATARDALLAAVQALVGAGRVWALAGMRGEFYPEAAGHPVLGALKAGEGQYDLSPPNEAELGEIIRYPARAAGMDFELREGRRLDARLLENAAANPCALPLLEFTLDELYRRTRERGETVLSYADYAALGGLDGAVAQAAEDTVQALGEASLAAVRDVFRQLVDWDGGKALRRRAALADFRDDPAQWEAVGRLIEARLLSSDDNGASHAATVEPVHEALLRTWQRLRGWIAEDAELLAIRARMEELAGRWREAGRDVGYLLNPGKQEQDAKLLLKQPWVRLDVETAAFLDGSLQRIRRRRWLFRVGVGAVVVALGGFGYLNALERKKAETAAGLALQVVNRLTYQLPDRLENIPGTLQILQETFEQNADLLRRIDELRGETADSLREKASNLQKQGDQRLALGDLPGAMERYKAAHVILEKLAIQDPEDTDSQRNLSVSYNKVGDVQSAQGDLAGALASFRASLALREKLAAQDPANAGWQRDLSVSQEKIGDVQSAQGDLAGALASFRASLAIAEKLAAQDPANAGWQRDLSVSYEKIGDVQSAQGDLAGALASFRASLAIAEKLAAQDPANAGWQRDLSVSYNKVGEVQSAQGDLAGALASFRASLVIREKLAAQDPANAGWQRDLSVSYNKVGEVQSAQGDLAGALASFRASLVIREKLAAQDPANAGWQRDLSVSYNKVGDVQSAQGDLAGALASYRASLALREKLAAQDPANAGWQRDLSVSYNKVGEVQSAQGDLAGALASFRASHAIFEKLAAQDPANAGWQRDLSVSYEKIGDAQSAQGDLAGALASYRASLTLREKLAAQDPANAGWQRDLSVSYNKVGEVQSAQGDLAGALASFRASHAIFEKLAAQDPANAGWQRDLSVSYEKIGDAQSAQGDLAGALASYRASLTLREKLAAQDPANAGWQGDLAFSHGKLGLLLRKLQKPTAALAEFQAALALLEPLSAKTPDHVQWRQALEFIKGQIAEIEATSGNSPNGRKQH